MRASTFFAIVIAVLIGFAAVGAARYFGLFRTPPPAVIPPRVELPKVLVAKKNLFEGIVMTPVDVQVREMSADEYKEYQKEPGKYLNATVEAATFRVPNENIQAGTILLKEHLEPLVLPVGLSKLILPGMRGVHVSVSKDHAVGGMIRVGDRVDVLLTTQITGTGNGPMTSTRTACIARDLRVIGKRDILFNVLAAVPEGKPIQFILEANPYRAALVEFARGKGQLTLEPTPTQPLPKDAKPAAQPNFSDPDSMEYKNEDERIAAILRGDRAVGDADLERIFRLPPLPVRENIRVELLSGNAVKGVSQFTRTVSKQELPPVDPEQPSYGYHFGLPPSAAVEPAPTKIRPAPKTK